MEGFFGRTRKLTSLRKGDIVNINAPYEENTRDYYNGYKPEEIRGHRFTDRFGNSSKRRMVIYIGRDGQTMLYLPLTSQRARYDYLHQYELKDNSMTPHSDPNRKSYVEVDSLRAIFISYQRELPYTGRINKDDLDNILHRLSNTTLQLNSKHDQRGYIPIHMEDVFVKELKHQGFRLTREKDGRKTYEKKSGEIVTHTKYGAVYYHVPMTKEQVRSMISHLEGNDILAEYNHYHKRMDFASNNNRKNQRKRESFSENVNQLSNQYRKGQIDYVNTC